MPDLGASVWPAITLLLGYAAKAVEDWVRDNRTYKREQAARLESRRDKLQERRADFQRETLLALQDECWKLQRACGRSHHEDTLSFRETGQWGTTQLSEEANTGAFESTKNIGRLRVRVHDENVRSLAAQMTSKVSETLLARSKEDADLRLSESMEIAKELNERIGFLIRSIDDMPIG